MDIADPAGSFAGGLQMCGDSDSTTLSSREILSAAIRESLAILGIEDGDLSVESLECLSARINGEASASTGASSSSGAKSSSGASSVTWADGLAPTEKGEKAQKSDKADKDSDRKKDDENDKEKEKEKDQEGGEKKEKKDKEGGDKKDKKDKKKKEKGPLRYIQIAYKIDGVADINAYTGTFAIDMTVFLWWKDEKLIGRPEGDTVDYSEKGLYEPHVVVNNAFQLDEISSVTTIVTPETGEVMRSTNYKGSCFIQSMTLEMFPYDCQNVQVC
jgi:hypothetical protein